MDEERVVVGADDDNDDGLGSLLLQWPASSTAPELEDARAYLADERSSAKSAVTARRLNLLREFFHFLQFGENGDDFPLVPGEPMTSDDTNMELFLAKYDLEADPAGGSFSLDNEDIIYSYTSALSTPPPEDEDIATEDAEDASNVHADSEMPEEHDLGELGYPTLEVAPSSPSQGDQSEREEVLLEDDIAMDVDEPDISSPLPPSNAEPEPEPEPEEDASDIEEDIEDQDDTLTQDVQTLDGSPGDTDPLDIISLHSRSPTSARSRSLSNAPATEQTPGDSDAAEEEAEAEAEAEREAGEDIGDTEVEADESDREEEETALPSSAAQEEINSQAIKVDSPSPSPSLKPPLPSEDIRMRPTKENVPSSSLPAKPPLPPVIVRITSSQHEHQPSYSFVKDSPPPTTTTRAPPPSPPSRIKAATRYTLPPLNTLPPELQKKGKPPKLRKKDRDKERSGSENGKKEEWTPLGMTRWAAILRTNPVFKRVSRAPKTVSTRDWNVSMQELKLIRVFDRVELLKDAGRWSFRQPKKQKCAALQKTHWDYLLDEMKWLQVDFKEERRWKIALAYELAQEVLEWHEAGSWEERVALGICAPWKRPDPPDPSFAEMDVDDNHVFAPDGVQEPLPLLSASEDNQMMGNMSEDEQDDDIHNSHDVDDVLHPSAALSDAVKEQEAPASEVDDPPDISPKIEEVESENVLHQPPGVIGKGDAMDLDECSDPSCTMMAAAKVEATDNARAPDGLKGTSNNPMMAQSDGDPGSQSADTPSGPSNPQSERTQALRTAIASLPDDALFLPFEALTLASPSESTRDPSELDLSSVFPELQPYAFNDFNPSDIVASSSEGRKKGDKKADKEDPTKRVDDTTATKLYPTGFFMHNKPTLVSALQPSRKWRKGEWINLDESPVIADFEAATANVADSSNNSSLWEGHHKYAPAPPPRDRRRLDLPWSQAEDSLLKKLADRYGNYWRLVADSINSSRIRSKSDLRTAAECFERWKTRWGGGGGGMGHRGSIVSASGSVASMDDFEPPPPTPASTSSQMTTRGVRRMAATTSASASTSNGNNVVAAGAGTHFVESRKRRRHFLVNEAMKSVSRKREQHLKGSTNTKKQTGPVHDTHLVYDVKQKYTPQELSRLKAEKDNEDQKLAIARRQDELRRQHQMRLQMLANREQQLQNDPARAQAMAAAAAAAQQQGVPQIRSSQVNISQQQQQQQQAKISGQPAAVPPMSPQAMLQYQQRAMAAAQAQAQAQQAAQTQLQGQPANGASQPAPFPNRGAGAASPQSQHSSPPRSSATPANAAGAASFPRPASAQRLAMTGGGQALPAAAAAAGQVSVPGNPIARHSNANMAAYFAANGAQPSPEQMAQILRYQQMQHQHAQLQISQQQQQLQQQQSQQQNGFTGAST